MPKKVQYRSMWGKHTGKDPLPNLKIDKETEAAVREAMKNLPPPPGIDRYRPHPDADPRWLVLD